MDVALLGGILPKCVQLRVILLSVLTSNIILPKVWSALCHSVKYFSAQCHVANCGGAVSLEFNIFCIFCVKLLNFAPIFVASEFKFRANFRCVRI